MMKPSIIIFLSLSLLFSCKSEKIEESINNPIQEDGDKSDSLLDVYHVRDRDMPYPKMSNELFLNPPPLIVPEDKVHSNDYIQFCLSSDENFESPGTMFSDAKKWNVYNPHRVLENGIWYWKYRYVDMNGNDGDWSETISFEVKENTPVFLTPLFKVFFNNAPTSHPRLQCFTDDNIERVRETIYDNNGFSVLKNSADNAIKSLKNSDVTSLTFEFLRRYFSPLYKAYYLTLNEDYRYYMEVIFHELISMSGGSNASSNFDTSGAALCLMEYYDIFYDKINLQERERCEEILYEILEGYYENKCQGAVSRLYDNHFWQQNYRTFLQLAFMLYDKPKYMERVYPMLEFCYELWTARAPAWGVNTDGSWQNGIYYYGTNMETLYYVPLLFSYITGSDFLQHPWYKNAGKSLVYSFPPGSNFAGGFGDGHERFTDAGKTRVAFADFLARETEDIYAGWYVEQYKDLLLEDETMVIYRLTSGDYSNNEVPESLDKIIWWKDAGEVAMHSDIKNISNNLSLTFRSSVFGSGSHTSASQNAFNIVYKGQPVFISSGYYDGFGTKHNLLSYRHTRAHNTILVNGIGQPFSTSGYGCITRAMGGNNITYCLGDASNAYSGITTDETWTNAFAAYGITQTPEYGFGDTPLKRYRRHIAMLHPDIIVIYDELEADVPARWDWLLHSNTVFDFEDDTYKISTYIPEYDIKASVQIFCNDVIQLSQTDLFVAKPEKDNTQYPNQWHLTASVYDKSNIRLLSIFKIGNNETLFDVNREGNTFYVDDWVIEAQMDAFNEASLRINNVNKPCILDLGSEHFNINDKEYNRTYLHSTVLYDEIDGKYNIEEQGDRLPIASRSN